MSTNLKAVAASETPNEEGVSPRSKELVIGLIGYAGAGCSNVATYLSSRLETRGYAFKTIKLSRLIEEHEPEAKAKAAGASEKLSRAEHLQNAGDELRTKYGDAAVAQLAIQKIKKERGTTKPGERRIAFILDSIKHPEEVELLRRVYDRSFRLIAVHADQAVRFGRLHGDKGATTKFAGASKGEVEKFLVRDEEDVDNDRGQHVRDAFYLADYFIDNNVDMPQSKIPHLFAEEIDRFLNLLLGVGLVRPTPREVGMYFAHVASLQSSCLSRQVGASIQSPDGRIVATGTNEVPKFGGGVYGEAHQPDERCFRFKFEPTDGSVAYVGCHNSRKKKEIREGIIEAIAELASSAAAEAVAPRPSGQIDLNSTKRDQIKTAVLATLRDKGGYARIPYIKDLIEFSRSVHAEMNAIINAGRGGFGTDDHLLYTTTYPCHNCARHILAAGIKEVYFIEPYVKSLTRELHSDAITSDASEKSKMLIAPFTGVGPRMYEDYFRKTRDLKNGTTGAYVEPKGTAHELGVRVFDIGLVEDRAAELVAKAGSA